MAGPLAHVFLRHAFLDQLVEVSLDRLLVVVSGATDNGEAASSAVTPSTQQRFEPFGQMKDNKLKSGEGVLQLVGCDTKTGALVRYDAQSLGWPPTLEEPSGVKVVRYDELRPD